MNNEERIEAMENKLREAEAREAAERRASDRARIARELLALGHGPSTSKAIASLLAQEGGPVRRGAGGELVYDGAPSLREGLERFVRTRWTEGAQRETQSEAEAAPTRGAKLLDALREAMPQPSPRPSQRGAALLAAVRGTSQE